MEQFLNIRLSFGRNVKIHLETYRAVKRALPIMRDDAKVARYAAAPHEGLTPEIVDAIRRRMIARGELPARSHSRREENVHGTAHTFPNARG